MVSFTLYVFITEEHSSYIQYVLENADHTHISSTVTLTVSCLTFSVKFLHSLAVSSSALSWARATLRSLVHRCHSDDTEWLMTALLDSEMICSNSVAFSFKAFRGNSSRSM